MAERQTASLVDGVFFLPFDYASSIRRVFRTIRPVLLIVVETELWPNLFAIASQSGTSVAIINGRISDRTWPTYQKWKTLFASLLRIPDLVQVQSEVDRARYLELGVPASSLLVDGNLKFDAALPATPTNVPAFGAKQIWIAASTVGPNERGSIEAHAVDEDDVVLSAFQQLADEFPSLLLILAPRQPARFESVASKLLALRLNFQRRSAPIGELTLPGVLLLDTMGELASTYPLANVVFVGGSIAPRGGHNIIEAAVSGVPIIVGPHMQNFEAITRRFLDAKAILQIKAADELVPAVRALLNDRDRSKHLGRCARDFVDNQRGVSERALDRLMPLYFLGSFQPPHSLPVQIILNGLSRVWEFGGALKREQGERLAEKRERLPVPVVSVGGIGMGGAGKTPFTIALAQMLQRRGAHPGILTRGYKRRSKTTIIAEPGASLSANDTGDEAQLLLRSRLAPVGIGADRYLAAKALLTQLPATDVLLLDDGFQHARTRRDIDVVLIDALDPFGNGRVVPAGKLREPLTALARAHIAVITKCQSDERFSAIAHKLQSYNRHIEIFRTDTVTKSWRSVATGQPVELSSTRKAGAFCGLGNPRSFWQSLDSLGIATVLRKAFRDHHRYRRTELTNLAEQVSKQGADVLLTTEKDLFNLPADLPPIELLYLPIELTVRDEERFLLILKRYFDR